MYLFEQLSENCKSILVQKSTLFIVSHINIDVKLLLEQTKSMRMVLSGSIECSGSIDRELT